MEKPKKEYRPNWMREALVAWWRKFVAVTRVTAYCAFAFAVCAALAARASYADFREASLQFGRELAPLAEELGNTKTVLINGAQMQVSNARTDETPKVVLDHFEQVCREHPQFMARALADLPEAGKKEFEKRLPDDRLRLAILRSGDDANGALICFTDDRPASSLTLKERFDSFARSGDLAEFGHLRYVFAKKNSDGKTHVTTISTEGSLKLGEMFPAKGDAAGNDSFAIPRPPNARRILSAGAAQVPYAVRIYDSTERRENVRRFYEEEMTARGWKPVATPATDDVLGYMLDTGTFLYLTLGTRQGHTVVTAIETAGRPGTPTEVRIGSPD
ncbi:MAG TPA: hypothetical protein VGI39_24580 [Polyangiaceae bacterium]